MPGQGYPFDPDIRSRVATTMYRLLPALYRIRDAPPGNLYSFENLVGDLGKFVNILAAPLAEVRQNIEELHADLFIDTCNDWVLPYLAEMIGMTTVFPDANSNRRDVRGTVGWRRRKGNPHLLQEMAAELVGPVVITEEGWHRVLLSQDLNQLRFERTVPLITPATVAEIGTGPLDATYHAIDAREISAVTGRYHPKDMVHYLFPTQLFPLTGGTAYRRNDPNASDFRYTFDPLGTPLQLRVRKTNPQDPVKTDRVAPMLFADQPGTFFDQDGRFSVYVCGLTAAVPSASTEARTASTIPADPTLVQSSAKLRFLDYTTERLDNPIEVALVCALGPAIHLGDVPLDPITNLSTFTPDLVTYPPLVRGTVVISTDGPSSPIPGDASVRVPYLVQQDGTTASRVMIAMIRLRATTESGGFFPGGVVEIASDLLEGALQSRDVSLSVEGFLTGALVVQLPATWVHDARWFYLAADGSVYDAQSSDAQWQRNGKTSAPDAAIPYDPTTLGVPTLLPQLTFFGKTAPVQLVTGPGAAWPPLAPTAKEERMTRMPSSLWAGPVFMHGGFALEDQLQAVCPYYSGTNSGTAFQNVNFINPPIPSQLAVTFQPNWNGGDITITGLDATATLISETIPSADIFGGTFSTQNAFATIQTVTKSADPAPSVSSGVAIGLLNQVADLGLDNDTSFVNPGLAANAGVTSFSGSFAPLPSPQPVTVTFGMGTNPSTGQPANWDGGSITVTGLDANGRPQSEVFAPEPGNTVLGSAVFSKITAVTKQYPDGVTTPVSSAVASIGIDTGARFSLTFASRHIADGVATYNPFARLDWRGPDPARYPNLRWVGLDVNGRPLLNPADMVTRFGDIAKLRDSAPLHFEFVVRLEGNRPGLHLPPSEVAFMTDDGKSVLIHLPGMSTTPVPTANTAGTTTPFNWKSGYTSLGHQQVNFAGGPGTSPLPSAGGLPFTSTIQINITAPGDVGAMTFTYSIGGGATSATQTTQAGASYSYQIPGTATLVTFPSGAYAAGDTFTITPVTTLGNASPGASVGIDGSTRLDGSQESTRFALGGIAPIASASGPTINVSAISIANIGTLSGTPVIDGYSTAAGNYVLLIGQTVASQNGVWIVGSGAWTRPPEFPTGLHAQGVAIHVTGGKTLAQTTWLCNSFKGSDVVDTNGITFGRIGEPTAPSQQVAAVATTSVSPLSGTPKIDGVALQAGNLVLLTAQNTPTQNGVWQVSAGGWSRPSSFPSQMPSMNLAFFVTGGNTWANSTWYVVNSGRNWVDSDALTIVPAIPPATNFYPTHQRRRVERRSLCKWDHEALQGMIWTGTRPGYLDIDPLVGYFAFNINQPPQTYPPSPFQPNPALVPSSVTVSYQDGYSDHVGARPAPREILLGTRLARPTRLVCGAGGLHANAPADWHQIPQYRTLTDAFNAITLGPHKDEVVQFEDSASYVESPVWPSGPRTLTVQAAELERPVLRIQNWTFASSGVIHGPVPANAANFIPGPFHNPETPFYVTVTFNPGWDVGLNIIVTGTDVNGGPVSEFFVGTPGQTIVGTTLFETVTAANKTGVGTSGATATIGVQIDPPNPIVPPYAANAPVNAFPGPFDNPYGPFNVTATFDPGWDGGNVVIVGTDPNGADQTEVLPSSPGKTIVGIKLFQALTSAEKVVDPNNPLTTGTTTANVVLGARSVYDTITFIGLEMGGIDPNTPLEVLFPTAKNVSLQFCTMTHASDLLTFQASADGSQISIGRSVMARIQMSGTGTISASDSVFDASGAPGPAILASEATADLARVTVFGNVTSLVLDATEVLFNDKVVALDRFHGCIRFSRVPADVDVAIAAAYAANQPNQFPGPFPNNRGTSGKAKVTFDLGWDGGDVVVVGIDANGNPLAETIPSSPGISAFGEQEFAQLTTAYKGWRGALTLPLAANSQTAAFALPITAPVPGAFYPAVLFDQGWDGGAVTVNGLDTAPVPNPISVQLASSPGGIVISNVAFSAVTGATKGAQPGLSTGSATLGAMQVGTSTYTAAIDLFIHSELPRQHRVVIGVNVKYVSRHRADPAHARLADDADPAITQGAEDGSEIGVFNGGDSQLGGVRLSQRRAGLVTRFSEYTPAGLLTGIVRQD